MVVSKIIHSDIYRSYVRIFLKNKILLRIRLKIVPQCNMIILSLPEVVEHCCSITSLQLGETLQGIAKDMDTMSYRIPLGVTAGITPFNFPAMIPLWVNIFTYNHTIYLAVYTTGLMIGQIASYDFKGKHWTVIDPVVCVFTPGQMDHGFDPW